MKILRLDDHVLLGKSFKAAINQHSKVDQCLFLSDPALLNAQLKTFQADVILLDIHMGEWNGFDLARELLKHPPCKLVFYPVITGLNIAGKLLK